MADDKGGSNVMGDVLWFFGLLGVLIVLWYFAGGPGKADLRGLFLAPPAPLGSGEAYGPNFGSSTESTPQESEPQFTPTEGAYNY